MWESKLSQSLAVRLSRDAELYRRDFLCHLFVALCLYRFWLLCLPRLNAYVPRFDLVSLPRNCGPAARLEIQLGLVLAQRGKCRLARVATRIFWR